jgi:4-hydroxymandelate oxidase
MHPVLRAHLEATPQHVRDWAFGSDDTWEAWSLRPRVLRDVSAVSTTLTLYGEQLASPIGVAPTATHDRAHPDAEAATVHGAAGHLLVVSSRRSIPARPVGPWWWQAYVLRDRDATLRAALDAAELGASAIVLTGDTPYLGSPRREPLVELEQDPAATLDEVRWLATETGLPVLVKGVLRADDAVACLEAGASGVVVSNHGGRQLPRAVASSYALPEVVDAVAGRVPVLVDGGARSGTDALCALALGATAVLVGRPILWGLAADGSQGVRDCLDALTTDLRHIMGLAGCASLADIDRTLVARA